LGGAVSCAAVCNGESRRDARDLAGSKMNGDLPLVSVVIPAYNHADYLDEAIRSVLDQDYPNVELIVLDDGSTDDTSEVLEKYTGRFYWETQENMGQYATLDKGWRMSEGEVLAYLSADDVLLPNAIGTSVRHLFANPDAVLTYCDYYLIDASSSVIRKVRAPEFDYKEMVAKLICSPGPGAFFLRSAYDATGEWDASLRQIGDYDYWIKLGLRGRFVKIPEMLAALRVHEGSQTFAATDEGKSEEYVRVISDYYETQPVPPDVLAAKDEALSNARIFAARAHLRSKRYLLGLHRLYEGLSLYPKNLSVRTARILAHGLFNHVRHAIGQRKAKKSRKQR
jgi:glycosyltransferase involved in cell wall biosynthesis